MATSKKKATKKKKAAKKKSKPKKEKPIFQRPYKEQCKALGLGVFEQFEKLCRHHCTKQEIASILGFSTQRLTSLIICFYTHVSEDYKVDVEPGKKPRFTDIYNHFAAGGKHSLRRRQYTKALEGDASMLRHLGEHWLGQKPTQNVNHGGSIHTNLAHALLEYSGEGDLNLDKDDDAE